MEGIRSRVQVRTVSIKEVIGTKFMIKKERKEKERGKEKEWIKKEERVKENKVMVLSKRLLQEVVIRADSMDTHRNTAQI